MIVPAPTHIPAPMQAPTTKHIRDIFPFATVSIGRYDIFINLTYVRSCTDLLKRPTSKYSPTLKIVFIHLIKDFEITVWNIVSSKINTYSV